MAILGVLSLPLLLLLSWVFALVGIAPFGAEASDTFADTAMRWVLFLALGWGGLGGFVTHVFFGRQVAKSIGWEHNGFQTEVGFANLAIGVAGVVASLLTGDAWIVATVAGTAFLGMAGVNHVIEIVREKNYAPGNTLILISDFGIPISLWALLFATGTIG
jgi:hypothetical protein